LGTPAARCSHCRSLGQPTWLKELKQAVRQHLAWSSIWDQRETLNLDPHQTHQAETRRKSAEETVRVRIPETYQWLIVPEQPDPKSTAIEWKEIRLQGQDPLAVRAARKLKTEELLVSEMGGTRLRYELDLIPLWRGQEVSVKQLADDVARYLYLPRLRDTGVLIKAIEDGLSRLSWREETFASAEAFNEKRQRYEGLCAGRSVRVLTDGRSVLVKPDVAAKQMEEEERERNKGSEVVTTGTGPETASAGRKKGEQGTAVVTPPPQPTRFSGSVKLDPARPVRDAERVIQEVVQHLTALAGADVEIRVDIQAHHAAGLPDKLVRDLTENCGALRFDSCEFDQG
jgi:hypothetical protein